MILVRTVRAMCLIISQENFQPKPSVFGFYLFMLFKHQTDKQTNKQNKSSDLDVINSIYFSIIPETLCKKRQGLHILSCVNHV